jgi:cysteine desulfurase
LRVEREAPGNPASGHRSGRRAQAELESARARVATLLRCAPREVVFVSGATEANNLALYGAARALARLGEAKPLLIASGAEHPAVLAPLRVLQNEGWPLRLLPVDGAARVEVGAAAALLADAPATLLALQWANNETGAVQDLARAVALGAAVSHFHVDGAQGFGKLPWDPALAAAHTIAISGHKFGAPKGIGALRVAEGVLLDAVLVGGGQQRGRRGGTETPALAAAFACALELACAEQEAFARATEACCAEFLQAARAGGVPFVVRSPSEAPRLPNTLSLTLPGVDGRALLPACDAEGLDVSSGAACASGAPLPSAVLLATGASEAEARATVRISFGAGSTRAQAGEAGKRFAALSRRLYEVALP